MAAAVKAIDLEHQLPTPKLFGGWALDCVIRFPDAPLAHGKEVTETG
jgi:hypothetical protein